MIEAKLKDAPYAQRLRPQAFHGAFKRLLAEAHWPQDLYPYTTDTVAYESLRRYLHARTAQLQQARLQRRTPPARNLGVPAPRARALRAIQIDEQVFDCAGRVHLLLNDELVPLRIARATVLTAVDVDTSCALAGHLTPSHHPNQEDLLTLLAGCVEPWQPRDLATPGLRYTPGARFPSGAPHGFPISFGTVQLDNALMHRAHAVADVLCDRYGATLSLGLPATPKVRHLVEHLFDYLGTLGSHRFAATTGSDPTDPDRESRKNRKKPPTVTFQTLEEALSVLLTDYNVTPQAVLGGQTPLALFEHHCAHHYVRQPPPALQQQMLFALGSAEVALHWYRNDHRAPHINFEYVRYQGPGLARICATHRRIRVTFHRRDIRTLHAYTLDGEDLGLLYAPLSWQRFPHSIATRRWLHKHARAYRFSSRDPLGDYFQWLLQHRDQPHVALSLLRVYQEFTHGQPGPLVLSAPGSATARTTVQATWRMDRAQHRGPRQ